MNTNDKLKQAISNIKKKRSVEDELYDMFTKKQLCLLLGNPVSEKDFPIGISKAKLARALVLKWKVENNE